MRTIENSAIIGTNNFNNCSQSPSTVIYSLSNQEHWSGI